METKEEFVVFATAELLKENGFDWACKSYYMPEREILYGCSAFNWNQFKDKISRPTQALAQRWLREVKKVYILIELDANGIKYSITTPESSQSSIFYYSTYEEALKTALFVVARSLSRQVNDTEGKNEQ